MFTKTTTGWKHAATLEASDHAPGDEFGAAVAISGSTIAVGDDWPSNNDSCGRVYIFTKTATARAGSSLLADRGHRTGASSPEFRVSPIWSVIDMAIGERTGGPVDRPDTTAAGRSSVTGQAVMP